MYRVTACHAIMKYTTRPRTARGLFLRCFATKRQQRQAAKKAALVVKTDMSEWRTTQVDGIKNSQDNNNDFETFESGIVKPDVTPAMIELTDIYDQRLHYTPSFDADLYEASTPLSQEMIQLLAVTNRPMTVAEYMRQALTHPVHGYYTNPTRTTTTIANDNDDDDDWDTDDDLDGSAHDVIGKRGDFVTAPEISQVFGECLALWFVHYLEARTTTTTPNNKSIRIVEIGPGKGTLMADVIRTLQTSFPQFDIEQVHFIEKSPAMRKQQKEALSGIGDELNVLWHDFFLDLVADDRKQDNKMPTLVICQEFIDALPIHVFENTAKGWRERLVDIADTENIDTLQQDQGKKTRLRFVTSPDTTPAVRTLLNLDQQDAMPEGQVVEVCPEGIVLVQDIAKYLEQQGGGACLVVDYGQEGTGDTLRGFSRHKQVDVLSHPGQIDVTADVDFAALKHAVNHQKQQNSARAFGPVTQGQFLASMGIVERVSQLIDLDETTDKQAHDLYAALERLVLPEQMGERYKVLSIVCGDGETEVPAGFESTE